jgi:hypoxanthine-DNA glycosylase
MSGQVIGLPPFYNGDSRLLILGSFPSVKSRQASFYYGNKQNRFWGVLSTFFGEQPLCDTQDKKDFLTRHKIALWDVVTSCEINGSSDASIKNFTLADINWLIGQTQIKTIIINGGRAAKIFFKNFDGIDLPIIALPSTSHANVRFDKKEWEDALRTAFAGT